MADTPAAEQAAGVGAVGALKVATVGAGYFSQFHHAAWAADPRTTLVAVCDQDVDKAAAFARVYRAPRYYRDVARMLRDEAPDLVDLIIPPTGHAALITLCLEAKVATICQKPFCRSLEEAKVMARAAQDAGVPLIVHENFRFSPWYRTVKRLMDEGAIGTLYQASFRLRPGDGQGPKAYLDRQPYFQTMERFLVHETAIHFIDTFRYLFGEPSAVYADLRQLNPAICGEDAGHILLNFPDGQRALFDGNRLADHVADNKRLTMGELMVDGSAGSLSVDGYGRVFLRKFGDNESVMVGEPFDASQFAGGAVAALQRHVVGHLLDGTPVENSAADYIANLRIEDAVYQSAASGERLALR
ncbi:MAG: Gfo/Idh/MocA family oxidoreductase [Pseudomonadota bacterium]